jgi:hypothetical protein
VCQSSRFLVIIFFKPVMPPKKAAAKKKDNKNPENGGEMDAETKAKMYMLTVQSLQVQLG